MLTILLSKYKAELFVVLAVFGLLAAVYLNGRHQGTVAAERTSYKAQVEKLEGDLKIQQENFKRLEEEKIKQKKVVSDVRKRVDDAYRAGRVPDRVRKFYIDTPAAACSPTSV